MSALHWILWWAFGVEVVRFGLGTREHANRIVRHSPTGERYVRFLGIEYESEGRSWTTIAPPQPPIWRRIAQPNRMCSCGDVVTDVGETECWICRSLDGEAGQ